MKRDVLDAAAESLRDAGAGISISAHEGAARVLRDIKRQSRRRRTARLAFVQVFALLIGFGAWAATSGRLDRFVRERVWQSQPKPRVAHTSVRPTRSAPSDGYSIPQEYPTAPPAIAPETGAVAAAPLTPTRTQPRRHVMAKLQPPDEKADLVQPPPSTLALYEAAHDAHFGRKDWATALALWDVYLKSGDLSFSVEARYNRALALVRLEKKAEAAEALRPFAEGEYGAYRRNDALRLLQWIERPSN